MSDESTYSSPIQIFKIFLRLGLTSFGGPIAHIAYMHQEFVQKRKWFSDENYAEIVALCQFLPGPTSSQVGMVIGMCKGGYWSAICAWLGFTLPSAILMILASLFFIHTDNFGAQHWIHGLKIVAVAIVAQAIISMGQAFCTDFLKWLIMLFSAITLVVFQNSIMQILTILAAGIIGICVFKNKISEPSHWNAIETSARSGFIALSFFSFLLAAPLFLSIYGSEFCKIWSIFYRSGSLVFGGGHVILPILQAELVPQGLISKEAFLAGYGLAQALPGPLFTFAGFLGVGLNSPMSGIWGGILALMAVFAPSFLLVCAALPFWRKIRQHAFLNRALLGINAAVVGVLLAAFYNPILTSTVLRLADVIWAVCAWTALKYGKIPIWCVVILSAMLGWLIP